MILFVDNEPVRIAPWVRAFEAAFGEVKLITDAQQAIAFLESEPRPPVDLLVWDLMMPTTGRLTDEETALGTRTGLVVHRVFRSRYPKVPAILLTNVRDDALLARYDSATDRAGRKDRLTPRPAIALAREMGVGGGEPTE